MSGGRAPREVRGQGDATGGDGIFCDVCGGGYRDLLFIGRDRLYGVPGWFPLVRCQDCGLVYVSPRPSFDEMSRYYPQEDYDLYNKAAGLKDRSLEELGRLLGPRKGLIERYRRPGRLLDIGFGDGSFLYFMKETGWDVTGVDANEKMVELMTQAGIDARAGQLEDAGFGDGAFDVVTLWGVLEHVQSPRRTIDEIGRITGEDSLLVIYTQNAAAPEAGLLGPDWFIYEVPRHLYSFNLGNLERLLAAGGFRVVETVYETPLYYCQMNWQYFKERRLRRPGDVVHTPSFLDRLVVKGLSKYKKLVDGHRWSSAMTVYAVKGQGVRS
ncbi:MAG: class I SAM-dependent methyltransferase [Thermoleophilia bacterium]|nr:class I SAM-dependent methyltransferase [Thermoleophilia bacterium]